MLVVLWKSNYNIILIASHVDVVQVTGFSKKRTYPKYSHSNATNTQIMFESRAILLTHGGFLRFRISETQIRFRYIYQWLKTPKNSNPSLASILQARFFLPLLFSFCISMQSQSLSLLLKWKFILCMFCLSKRLKRS